MNTEPQPTTETAPATGVRTPGTVEPLTADAILDAVSTFPHELPRAALQQALERWTEIGPLFIAKLQDAADGSDQTEATKNILFFGLYLIAQMRDTAAYRPLCAVAARGEWLLGVLEDAAHEDLIPMFTRLFDGDPAPLRTLIENPDANEYLRFGGLGAVAWLTALGRLEQEDTRQYLLGLYDTLQPRDSCWVWVAWMTAVVRLRFDDMMPLVENVFDQGWIDSGWWTRKDLQREVERVRTATSPAEAFDGEHADDSRLDDAVAFLAEFPWFQPEFWQARPRPETEFAPLPETDVSISPAYVAPVVEQPVRNPHRNVGRNDPCPCGSGKKYKKCCLEAGR